MNKIFKLSIIFSLIIIPRIFASAVGESSFEVVKACNVQQLGLVKAFYVNPNNKSDFYDASDVETSELTDFRIAKGYYEVESILGEYMIFLPEGDKKSLIAIVNLRNSKVNEEIENNLAIAHPELFTPEEIVDFARPEDDLDDYARPEVNVIIAADYRGKGFATKILKHLNDNYLKPALGKPYAFPYYNNLKDCYEPKITEVPLKGVYSYIPIEITPLLKACARIGAFPYFMENSCGIKVGTPGDDIQLISVEGFAALMEISVLKTRSGLYYNPEANQYWEIIAREANPNLAFISKTIVLGDFSNCTYEEAPEYIEKLTAALNAYRNLGFRQFAFETNILAFLLLKRPMGVGGCEPDEDKVKKAIAILEEVQEHGNTWAHEQSRTHLFEIYNGNFGRKFKNPDAAVALIILERWIEQLMANSLRDVPFSCIIRNVLDFLEQRKDPRLGQFSQTLCDSTNPAIVEGLAEYMQRTGNRPKAHELFDKAMEIYADERMHGGCLFQKARMFEDDHNYVEAIACLEKLVLINQRSGHEDEDIIKWIQELRKKLAG